MEQPIFFGQFRNQIIFLRKNHTPPPLELNGRPLSDLYFKDNTNLLGDR